MQSFSELGVCARIVRLLAERDIHMPFPIQERVLGDALAGRDVLAKAPTGSGKTLAFAIPLVERLSVGDRRPSALVLVPTRELATQVAVELAAVAPKGVEVATVYGGVPVHAQAKRARGAHILVATPGRLNDLLERKAVALDGVAMLVLDEADRMLDMGFLPDIRRVLRHIPARRQTLFFSATMPPPIVELTREMLHQPVTINLQRQAAPAVGITQAVYPVAQELKSALLVALLRRGDIREALAFTRTKHRADRLAKFLVREGLKAERIHGNRSQAQRTAALAGFKDGKYQILVATDIAARGIDVEALGHVVNFDVPTTPEDYIHRVGRTARAEMTGDAFTFVSPAEEGDLRNIERVVGRRLPRIMVPDFDYQARPAERFEVPLGERIAAIRARKADERSRARAKSERRFGSGAGSSHRPGGHAPSAGHAGRSRSHRSPTGSQGRSGHPRGPAGSPQGGAPATSPSGGARRSFRRGPGRGSRPQSRWGRPR